MGEVHTSLLRHSTAVDTSTAVSLLELKAGAPVRYGERPVRYALSPNVLTGLDCRLASTQEVRGVGTAASRAILIGGQILQCSSSAQIVPSGEGRRQAWSHYLSRPGIVETVNKANPTNLLDGFLAAPVAPSTMDLGALNSHLHTRVQSHDQLDRRTAFRMPPVRLRWGAIAAASPSLSFSVGPEGYRSFVLRLPDVDRAGVLDLCEDIALHDWLLSSVQRLLETSRIGGADLRDVVKRLTPAVNFLLHLWMPGARLDDEMRAAWTSLEERSGFTRQWRASIDRVRDQLFLAAATGQLGPPLSSHSR
ncbi:MAG TPA: SCO2521 family protein [Candidatus Limnocylindrales bacterium]